jgi:hypothetical protein
MNGHPGQPWFSGMLNTSAPLHDNTYFGGVPCTATPPGDCSNQGTRLADHVPSKNELWRPDGPGYYVVRAWSNHVNPNWPSTGGASYVVIYGSDVSSRPRAYIGGSVWVFDCLGALINDLPSQTDTADKIMYDLTGGLLTPSDFPPGITVKTQLPDMVMPGSAFNPGVTSMARLGSNSSNRSGTCQGVNEGSHNPHNGVWWTPPKVGKDYLIINFWTNWKGYSQNSFKVKIPKSWHGQLAGGGSDWSFSCESGWTTAFQHNSLPAHSLRWMRNHGLARPT